MNKLLVVLVLVGMLCFFQADANKMQTFKCIKRAKKEFVNNGSCAALEVLADCLENDDLYATISAALPFEC